MLIPVYLYFFMTLQTRSQNPLIDECQGFGENNFWQMCGGCGLCQQVKVGKVLVKLCDYLYMANIFNPIMRSKCDVTNHCLPLGAVGCNILHCVPMLGTYKCVCNSKNLFGRLCQYSVKQGMTLKDFAVVENFLFTPYFTINEYITIFLTFSSLGSKNDLNIVIETLTERLVFDWTACQKLVDTDRSHDIVDYCNGLFTHNKQFCRSVLFQHKNVKWVFTVKIPFPGASFTVDGRRYIHQINDTVESTWSIWQSTWKSTYLGMLEPLKLAVKNKRDLNPVFEADFSSANIFISPQFSLCEPVVMFKEGGQSQYDIIKIPRCESIVIETLYFIPDWEKECIKRIEDLHIEWIVWTFGINHIEINNDYFIKKLQVQFIEFEKFSVEPAMYKVRNNVTIWKNGKEGFSTAYTYFQVITIDLEPIIKGGNSRSVYYRDSKIVLNGSMSRNPNSRQGEDLVYYWKCDKSLQICLGQYTIENYIIYYGPFLENEIYTFTLKVVSTKYNLHKTAVQTITMLSDPSPALEIICRKNCGGLGLKSNPAELSYLEVIIVNIPSTVKINNQFTWVYKAENENEFKSTESIKQPGTPSNVLIILPNTLLEGRTFFFKVNGGSNNPGEAIFQFQMASAVQSFECKVQEITVTFGEFSNTIKCDRLLFDNLSPTYAYFDRFPDKPDGKGRLLGYKKSNVLNQAAFVRGKLVVEITNQYGIMSSTELNLNVLPTKNPVILVESLLGDIEFYHTTVDSEYKANIVSAVVDIVFDQEEKFSRAYGIMERLLTIVNMETIHSIADMKVWAISMDILVNKGAKMKLGHISALNLGRIVAKLAESLKFNLLSSDDTFSAIGLSSREVLEIVQTFVNICNKIYPGENEVFEEEYYTSYKEITENVFLALEMIVSSLNKRRLPFMPPFIVKAKRIQIWIKEDTPISFYELSSNQTINESIPSVNISESLANFINHDWSNFVTVQVINFDENPFWWYKKLAISTNVVDLQLSVKKGNGNKYISKLNFPVQIYLDYRDLKTTVVNGTSKNPNMNESIENADLEIAIHTIRVEERGRIKLQFLNLHEGEIFTVLIELNMRPDYTLMMKIGKNITQSNPEYEQELQGPTSEDVYDLYYLGILTRQSHAREYMNYSFEIIILRCVSWHHSGWVTEGCKVKDILLDSKQLLCECEHLSSFAAFAGVPINTVDPFEDHELILSVLDNPFVAAFVVCILIIYVITLFYTVRKDHRDKRKQCAIYLEDNVPNDKHPYLVCVQTGARLFAGTTSNVGISLEGENSSSRPHILKSSMFKALERADDNWFVMFTPLYLGEIKLLHIWMDFSGNRPEWFCNKILVIDLTCDKNYTFLIDSWFSLRWNDHIERFEKTTKENYLEDLASDNFIYGFREAHLWMSIVSKHPRSVVTSSQRLSLAVCGLFAAMLTGCMFYKVDEQLEDYPTYKISHREILISVYSLIISAFITNSVLSLFRRQPIIFDDYSKDNGKEKPKKIKKSEKKNIEEIRKSRQVFVRFTEDVLSVFVGKKKFVPVHLDCDVIKKTNDWSIKPVCFQIVAWIFSILIIVFAAYLIILYGLKFGKIKSLEWLSSTVMSFGEEIFVVSPLKITALAVISGFLFSKIYKVNRYYINLHEISKYKENFINTKQDMVSQAVGLRGKSTYAPLQYSELRKKQGKQWKKDALWMLLDFLIITTLTALVFIKSGTLWTTKYYWNNLQLQSILKKRYTDEGFQIHEMKNITDYLPFLEKNILPLIYQLKWYNGIPISGEVSASEEVQRFVLSSTSSLLGLPRVRQRRQRPGLCRPNYFSTLPDLCPSRLTRYTEDTEVYAEGWKTGPFDKFLRSSPWNYQEPSESYGIVAFGYHTLTYNGGGYIGDLGLSQAESDDVTSYLISETWLDRLTSMVFFEMNLYNPNSGTLSVLIAVTERLYIGMVMNRLYIYTVSQYYHISVLDICLLASLLVFMIRVIIVFNRRGFTNVVINFWNVYEIVIVCLSIHCAFLYVNYIEKMKDHLEAYQKTDKKKYFHFINFITDLTYIQVVMIILVIMTVCRFMKSLKFVNIIFNTVLSGWRTVLWVVILITIYILFLLQFMYWTSICYFLNNFVLSRTFLIILRRLDFKFTVKNYLQFPCTVGFFILCEVSEVFTWLIIMHYAYIYKNLRRLRERKHLMEGGKELNNKMLLYVCRIFNDRKPYNNRRSY